MKFMGNFADYPNVRRLELPVKKVKYSFQGLAYAYGIEVEYPGYTLSVQPSFRPGKKWMIILESGKMPALSEKLGYAMTSREVFHILFALRGPKKSEYTFIAGRLEKRSKE